MSSIAYGARDPIEDSAPGRSPDRLPLLQQPLRVDEPLLDR
ncbi:hypothetical protein [Leekyejoonella antrihumi]|nr:hypothetical protein [Leekyejoonella antrihumi]